MFVAKKFFIEIKFAYFKANSIELFGLGRFMLGYSIIAGVGIGSVFLTECSPKYCRGAIGVMTGGFLNFCAKYL